MKNFLKLVLVVFLLAALAACSGKSKEGVTVRISAEKGGVIKTEDGSSITIPAGALAEDIEITMKIYTAEEFTEGGDSTEFVTGIVSLEPADLNFSKPVVISIPVAKAVNDLVSAAYFDLGRKIWQYSKEGLAVSMSKGENGQFVISTNQGDSVSVSADGSLVVNIEGREVLLSGKRDPFSITEDAEPISGTELNNSLNMAAGHLGSFAFVAVPDDDVNASDDEPAGDTEPVSDDDTEPVSEDDTEPVSEDDIEPVSDDDTESVSDDDTEPVSDGDTDEDADTTAEPTEAEKCIEAGGIWNETEESCTKTTSCGDLPENAEWNGASLYTQTYADNAWSAEIEVEYNETAGDCRFKCVSGFDWDGSMCTAAPQASLGTICTGQIKCYNGTEEIACPASSEEYFGQDAQYLDKCTQQSFTVQTTAEQNVVVDNNLGLMWLPTLSAETYTWDDAATYCGNIEYAGYSDWRLPAPLELLTIVDISRKNPAVNTENFPEMPTTSTYLWTNKDTGIIYTDETALTFNTYYGKMQDKQKKTNLYRVLCVRGDSLPKSQFITQTIGGEEVIKDLTTGLMWQKIYPDKTFGWADALKYCEDLSYAGYTDWRLPNKNELASLLDYDKTSKPYTAFPGMNAANTFWSSSSYTEKSVWTVNYNGGSVYDEFKTYYFDVRCVR